MSISVYTDGSCYPNPGPGGWAAVFMRREGKELVLVRTLKGAEQPSTNQRMELMAILKALQALPLNADVTIFTDSKYAKGCLTQWAARWRQRGWKKGNGTIPQNVDIIQPALEEFERRPDVRIHWVRGHNGNRGNELADQQALDARIRGRLDNFKPPVPPPTPFNRKQFRFELP